MTVFGLGAVLVVVGAACWWWRRVEAVLLDRLRYRELSTTAPSPKPAEPPTLSAPDPIPPILLQIAMEESEPWAREQAIRSMYELHDTTGDWGVVQQMFLVSRSPGNPS